ncbi:MAG: hypothetical protein ABIH63_01775 [archaeon]
MKNKTKILITAILMTLILAVSIKASIFATIGMKGLSFANPEAAQIVQTVISLQDPASFVGGYVVGQISGELVGEIAKQSPEAAQAIRQYNEIQGWVQEGAQIVEEVKLSDKGEMAGGKIAIGEEQDVSFLLNSKAERGSTKVSNMEISTAGEDQDITFTAKEGGVTEINGKRYENLKKGSKLIADREGQVKEADMTFTKATNLELGGRKIQAAEGMRVVYKDGVIDVYGKGQTVTVDSQKIGINSDNVKIDQQKITGEDFTLDNNRFTSTKEGELAEVTTKNEGYLLGKNTQAETNNLIVNSENGNVLLSKGCQNIGGFSNYANPCGKTLTMEGNGFNVALKEGQQYGLDIEKGDTLKYEMAGGKVVLKDGEEAISTAKGRVIVTNGDVKIQYRNADGVTQAFVDPNDVGEHPDVKVVTKYDELTTLADSETGAENVYACSAEGTGAITGGATFWERCKSLLGMNTQKINELVGQPLWEGETITEEKETKKYETSDGKTVYTKIIRTKDASGKEHSYSMSSDGTVYEWNYQRNRWEKQDYTLEEDSLTSLGIPKTETALAKAPTETITPKKEPSMLGAHMQRGEQEWEARRQYAMKLSVCGDDGRTQCTQKDYFLPTGLSLEQLEKSGRGYVKIQPAPYKGLQGPITAPGYIVEIQKDPRGGYILQSIDSQISFKPVGNKGVVKLISQ